MRDPAWPLNWLVHTVRSPIAYRWRIGGLLERSSSLPRNTGAILSARSLLLEDPGVSLQSSQDASSPPDVTCNAEVTGTWVRGCVKSYPDHIQTYLGNKSVLMECTWPSYLMEGRVRDTVGISVDIQIRKRDRWASALWQGRAGES